MSGDEQRPLNGSGAASPQPTAAAGGVVHVGPWLAAGWRLTMSAPWALVLLTFLWMVALGLVGGAGERGLLVPLVIGPSLAGLCGVVLGHARSGRVDFSRVRAAGDHFLQALLAGLLLTLMVAVGLFVLVIPGVIVAALYLFTIPLIVDRGLSFWDAMEASRKTVQRDVLGFLGFAAALVGINILGSACFGFGVLLSVSVSLCAVAAAYEELWPTS